MNKQELIERLEGLKNIFGNKCKYIEIDTVIELASKLDEPQKPVVQQFVADWYEENKDDFEGNLFRFINRLPAMYQDGEFSEFENWVIEAHTKPFQTLVNMHQFGYEVEEEKRYYVKTKKIADGCNYLNCRTSKNEWSFAGISEPIDYRTRHTREELEDAGFGWVFDCPGIEIEEVERWD